jgi:hypothetical protein
MNPIDPLSDAGSRPTDDDQRAKFEALKRDIMEGIAEADRGEVTELDIEKVIADARREHERRKKLEALRRDIMLGIEDIERGNVSDLTAEDIIAEGRRILAERRREA